MVCSGPPCACARRQAGRARLGETRAGQARHARFTEVQGLRGDMPSSRAGPTHPTGTWRNRGEECRNMLVWGVGRRTPPRWSGRGLLRLGLLAVLLAATRPDEAEGVAVCDEVGVDRDGEARIIQLDREKVAAFARALRPGGSDLGAANVDSVAGGVLSLARLVSGTKRTPLAWTLRVTISP